MYLLSFYLQPGMLILIVVCSCVGVIGLVITAALIITSRRVNCRQR